MNNHRDTISRLLEKVERDGLMARLLENQTDQEQNVIREELKKRTNDSITKILGGEVEPLAEGIAERLVETVREYEETKDVLRQRLKASHWAWIEAELAIVGTQLVICTVAVSLAIVLAGIMLGPSSWILICAAVGLVGIGLYLSSASRERAEAAGAAFPWHHQWINLVALPYVLVAVWAVIASFSEGKQLWIFKLLK